ncbi:MAG: bacillithiol biosynthesis deacetylase BshB1 [Planctomycetaceae bacterium]
MTAPGDSVEILAVGAHPDDVELSCGGLLLLMGRRGYRFALVDLTAGERGSRGDAETRAREAQAAAARLGAAGRACLGLPDTQLQESPGAVRLLIEAIRQWRPKLLLTMDGGDGHPDHRVCEALTRRAAFLAALPKAEAGGEAHRVRRLVRYGRHPHFAPSFVVDITDVLEAKLEVIRCHASQFRRSGGGARTPISDPAFEEDLKATWRFHGLAAGALYAEPYAIEGPPALLDPVAALCIQRRDF